MRASGERNARLDVDFRFREPEQGILLERLNRFLVRVKVRGQGADCFVANPARGQTLFRPGADVIVKKSQSPVRKTGYDLLLVRQDKTWVLVDTRIANQIVFQCLKGKKLPELAEYESIARETSWGRSRFDFRLSGRGKEAYLEVKSVSLAAGGVARFPDGVTERGRRHLEELSEMVRHGLGAFVLFLVERDDVAELTANFPVDPRFSASLLRAIARGVVPLSYNLICQPRGVRLGGRVPILAAESGSPPSEGCYHLVIELCQSVSLRHPGLGGAPFPAGFYIYTGSGKTNLLHRIARHLIRKHKRRWHIDYLLASPHARILDVIILPGRDQSECLANEEVGRMAGATVVQKGFGSSDCGYGCPAHLYWFERLPERFLKRLPGFAP